ncbi:unnamed protein product [Cylicocyclus nassatus]|uniref:A to I editase domain-containing protein n=1 Tax=Cylicocyclus nassatus TaxID=53992 RepID=A0AA36DVG8_CYLNA|nr:unnamed protein product [Cylicocyclus nassatus]
MFAASVRIGDIEVTGFLIVRKGIKAGNHVFRASSQAYLFKILQTQLSPARKHFSDKVIASIFLATRTNQNSSAEIISLATGNKGLRGDCLSLHGCSVNEPCGGYRTKNIVAVSVCSSLAVRKRSSIFVKNNSPGKLALRKGLSFHMFVNTAPCEDARVYSLNDVTLANAKEAETKRFLRSKWRMVWVPYWVPQNTLPQTIDGVMGGKRGLLSLFTDDLPLFSGSRCKSDTKRLERALYQRIDGFKPTAFFQLNKPLIGKCQDEPNTREVTTSLPISINWNLADNLVEDHLLGFNHVKEKL